jgi:uncharacterized protein with PQ loop repeat
VSAGYLFFKILIEISCIAWLVSAYLFRFFQVEGSRAKRRQPLAYFTSLCADAWIKLLLMADLNKK